MSFSTTWCLMMYHFRGRTMCAYWWCPRRSRKLPGPSAAAIRFFRFQSSWQLSGCSVRKAGGINNWQLFKSIGQILHVLHFVLLHVVNAKVNLRLQVKLDSMMPGDSEESTVFETCDQLFCQSIQHVPQSLIISSVIQKLRIPVLLYLRNSSIVKRWALRI